MPNPVNPTTGQITPAPTMAEASRPAEGDLNYLDQPVGSLMADMLAESPSFLSPDSIEPIEAPKFQSQPLSADAARTRAGRYSFATRGIEDVDPSTFYGDLMTGRDGELRERFATLDQMKQDEIKSNDTRTLLESKLPGEGLTPDDMFRIQKNAQPSPRRPSDVFERLFAGEAVRTAVSQPKEEGSHNLIDATQESPSAADIAMKHTERLIARAQYAAKKIEEIESNESTSMKVAGFLKGFIPFARELYTHNVFNESGGTSWLPSSNIEEAASYYYNLPDEEYGPALDKALAAMIDDYPELAVDFLHKVISYSSSDKMWDNLSPVIDIASVTPAVAFKLAGKGVGRLAGTLKNATEAVKGPEVTVSAAMSKMGNIHEVAFAKAKELREAQAGHMPRVSTMGAIDGEALSILQPETVVGGPTSALSSGYAIRLSSLLHKNAARFWNTMIRPGLRVDRLEGQSLVAAKEEATRIFKAQYPHANNAIMDIRVANKEDSLLNNDFIEFDIGKTTAEPFDDFKEASKFATEKLGLTEGNLVQIGDNKWKIVVGKPVDETSPLVRQAIDIQTKNATPVTRGNMLFGWMKGRHALVSDDTTKDLVAATYGASQLAKFGKAIYEPVGRLSKKSERKLRKFLEYQRDKNNFLSGERGEYSSSPGIFEKDWFDRYGEYPTVKEKDAYFVHTQVSDADWVLRNLSQVSLKLRKGYERFLVNFGGKNQLDLEGKFLPEFPWDIPENANVLLVDKNLATNIVNQPTKNFLKQTKFMKAAEKKELKERIAKGELKVIRLNRDSLSNLRNTDELAEALEKRHVDYVLVDNAQTRPLNMKQIPYKPGGHVEYANGSWFMKQPIIEVLGSGSNKIRTYSGDNVVLAFDTGAKAKKYLPRYEEARRLYAEVKSKLRPEKELADYVAKNLPDSLADFKRMFDAKHGGLNVNEKLYVVPKGSSVNDVHGLNQLYKHENIPFEDKFNSAHSDFTGEDLIRYTGEKNNPLLTIRERGTEDMPILDFRPATLLDPISTLSHASAQLMRGRYMDDVKIKYAQHFLSEFGDVLEPHFKENIRNPFQALVDAKFKTNYPDRARLAAAKNYRRSMAEFLGLKSEHAKDADYWRQLLADMVYEQYGDRGLELVAPHLLHRETDPARFMKQAAFHLRLGLFNPKQVLLQGQAVANVAAIDGNIARVTKGSGASMSQIYLQFTNDDDMIRKAAKYALGWNEDEFVEATRALFDSGFLNVGREVQLQEGFTSPRLRNSKWGKFLDWGTAPFNVGEQMPRSLAWNVSYLKWRTANPGKTLTEAVKKDILHRANIMTQNMSAANASMWQHGLKSVPTQFWSYRMRFAEQLLGKQLTKAEKARLFTVTSLMYGLPIGVTAAVPFLPVNEIVQQWANEAGVNWDDSQILKFLHDGVISPVIQMMTGEDYNIETALGPGPITQPWDLLHGDITIQKMFGGASGTVFADILRSAAPFMDAMMETLYDGVSPFNTVTDEDIRDAASFSATTDAAINAWYLIHDSKFYSKNHAHMADMEPTWSNLIAVGALGLGPQSVTDLYDLLDNMDARKELQKKESRAATRYYREAWKALRDKNAEEAMKYFRRAKLHMDRGGFTFAERARVLNNALRDNKSIVDSVDWEWAKTSQARMDAYRRKKTKQMEEENR